MKKILLLTALLTCTIVYSEPNNGLRLIFSDDFGGTSVDSTKWNVITPDKADWKRYMAPELASELIEVRDGNLVLIGKQIASGDTLRYVTGGLDSRGKGNFTYGRVDICARLESAKGAWPALWMVGDVPNRRWPDDGEIDIMEHLNYDSIVYQTAHTTYTVKYGIKDNPIQSGTATIERDGYNVYSLIRTPTKITWLINGKETFSYPKLDTPEAQDKGQWPYDHPFYLILSQQLGGPGTWVGEIDNKDLPVKMYIDYVRIYQTE